MPNKFILFFIRFYFSLIEVLNPKKVHLKLFKVFTAPRKLELKESEKNILLSSRKEVLEAGDNNLQIYIWGEGNKVAYLSHGWESNGGCLGAFVKPLLEKGYKVISFDAPAHNLSSGNTTNIIEYKEAVKNVINHFGKGDIHIGHSLGANILLLLLEETFFSPNKIFLISPFNSMERVFREFQRMIGFSDSTFSKLSHYINKLAGYDIIHILFEDIVEKFPEQSIYVIHDSRDKVTPFSESKNLMKSKIDNLFEIENTGHYKILWDKQTIEKVSSLL